MGLLQAPMFHQGRHHRLPRGRSSEILSTSFRAAGDEDLPSTALAAAPPTRPVPSPPGPTRPDPTRPVPANRVNSRAWISSASYRRRAGARARPQTGQYGPPGTEQLSYGTTDRVCHSMSLIHTPSDSQIGRPRQVTPHFVA